MQYVNMYVWKAPGILRDTKKHSVFVVDGLRKFGRACLSLLSSQNLTN